jgi:CYTH domain-containing protein
VTWAREPGRGSYARPERERRFLVRADPPALRDTRTIEDRYLNGTRLRLRHVHADGRSVWKLTQKVRVDEDDPADVRLTNTYLLAQEHARLSVLPGRTLVKSRSSCGGGFVFDAFRGVLDGLRLAEVEVEDLSAALLLPDWLGPEVTHDDRFSGGRLASLDPSAAVELLDGVRRLTD